MLGLRRTTTDVVELEEHLKDAIPQNQNKDVNAFRQILDSMPVNVMTCNVETMTIDYINQTSVETLSKIEELLPCKADEVLGSCIDIFHKDPSHQRDILSDPSNLPWRTNIRLGEEILDLQVNPIFDSEGVFSSLCLVWDIVTDTEKAKQDTERLLTMVDNMPINVMMADPEDFTITYVNRTSIDTLTPLNELLPCDAAELAGKCIDIFHEHPEHQRAMLADPANLPHTANIKTRRTYSPPRCRPHYEPGRRLYRPNAHLEHRDRPDSIRRGSPRNRLVGLKRRHGNGGFFPDDGCNGGGNQPAIQQYRRLCGTDGRQCAVCGIRYRGA